MNVELPDEFDIIVVGTGLSEAIVSGALSRIGKKVLHLDHATHYGSSWSSFTLKNFESWIKKCDEDNIIPDVSENAKQKVDTDTEELVYVKSIRKTTEQGSATCYLPHAPVLTEKVEESKTQNETNTETVTQNIPADASKLKDEVPVPDQKIAQEEETANAKGEDTKCQESVVEIATEEIKQVEDVCEKSDASDKTVEDIENVIVEKIGENSGIIKKVTKEEKPKQEVDKNTQEYFYSQYRHYNLDLAPKLMFSRGKLVELLITSNVCRYLEFRNVTRTLTLLDNGSNKPQKLAPVPCSRADVFASKFVTMIEKRMLMRVLTMCANYENHAEEYREFEDKKFVEFLAAKRLSKKLQHFILHSISMVSDDTSTLDGLKATQKFLRSLGRYGNSAFLWPLYGVGELPQAFCRLGAVFGGTFCLNRYIHAIIVNNETKQCVGIIDSAGQRLRCEKLILDECYIPDAHRVPFSNMVSRAVYVTDTSLLPADKDNISLITIPPTPELSPSRLIEVGSSSCVCPRKHFVVHAMTCIQPVEGEKLPSPQSQFSDMEKVLFKEIKIIENEPASDDGNEDGAATKSNDSSQNNEVQSELPSDKPQVLWASYFNMMSGGVDADSLPHNVYVTRGPSMDLGFDETVSEARRLFEAICPEEEFLPRAPNPDEIIYFDQDDEGYNTETNGAVVDQENQDDEAGEYQEEDENEMDVGSGEPADQEEVSTEAVAES